MTQKALYKKIEHCDPWSTGKDHKRCMPTRAKTKADAKQEATKEQDETMHPRISDYKEDDLIRFVSIEEDDLQPIADNDTVRVINEE